MINMFDYSQAVGKMREFFTGRGFVEVPIQSRLSILAACEDPSTVGQFKFTNVVWPLPQTGQMWLEYEILKNPGVPGVFCITTSYRDEKNPLPGRHDRIFPMFEFESHGSIDDLKQLEKDLLSHLGFTSKQTDVDYKKAAKFYKTSSLEAEHEMKMIHDFAPITFLTHFPGSTSPFWNMKQLDADRYAKIDVIMHGMETIGSAERSCNVEEMRHNFHTISDGQYAKLLYKLFTKARVEAELDAYLKLPMIPRFGAGIGVTRMIRAMKMEGLLEHSETAGEQKLSPAFA
jgi:aspartyl/asparaginyl-tRNA synthetase